MKTLYFFIFVCLSFALCDKETALILTDVEGDDDGIVQEDTENDPQINNERFIPTKEWQAIKEGQAIPSGLHVRMNLQTGIKEAKLMEGDDGSRYHSKEKLEEALKLIKPEEIKQLVKDEKRKFRHIDDIKKDFDEVMIKVKTETEILTELLKNYPKAKDTEKVEILQNIEYIVHQYDAAQDFVKMNGLELLIPDLNSTNAKIRSLVAYSLGSAMQGNPKVKIACLEKNVLGHLLRLLSFDPEPGVRNRAMFAISCLVRQFPLAQQHLLKSGGFTAFADVFKNHKWDLESQKLQMKIVNLVQDLITEQTLASKYNNPTDETNRERMRQYDKLNLGAVLVQNGFCKIVPRFLASSDIDAQEKVVSAMLALVDYCYEEFQHNLLELKQLDQEFAGKALLDNEDDYFSQLRSNVQNLIRALKNQPSSTSKEDL